MESDLQLSRLHPTLEIALRILIHEAGAAPSWMFSKRVTCLECDGDYRQTSAHGRNQKYSYYQHLGSCPARLKRVHAADFEKVVLRRLHLLASTPGLLEGVTKDQHRAVSNSLPAVEAERSAAESELRKTQEKIGALMDRIATLPRDMDASLLIQHARDLEAKKGQISDNIVRLNAEAAAVANQRANPEEVRKVSGLLCFISSGRVKQWRC